MPTGIPKPPKNTTEKLLWQDSERAVAERKLSAAIGLISNVVGCKTVQPCPERGCCEATGEHPDLLEMYQVTKGTGETFLHHTVM